MVTGATGLIGKETINPLISAGHDVFAISSRDIDLFDYKAINEFITKKKPEYLLHFAWITSGDYLSNSLNNRFQESSMKLLDSFVKNGGKRVVFAGTCFEYDFADEPLREDMKLVPKTLYAKCKVDLFKEACAFCADKGCSFAWGRIFYVFGHGEKEGRFTRYLLDTLIDNKIAEVKCSNLIRDYMYSSEIARAFIKLLLSDVQGAVNICTGIGISLGDYATKLAKLLGKENMLSLYDIDTNQPKRIVGNPTRLLKEVGFKFKYSMDEALEKIVLERLKDDI